MNKIKVELTNVNSKTNSESLQVKYLCPLYHIVLVTFLSRYLFGCKTSIVNITANTTPNLRVESPFYLLRLHWLTLMTYSSIISISNISSVIKIMSKFNCNVTNEILQN